MSANLLSRLIYTVLKLRFVKMQKNDLSLKIMKKNSKSFPLTKYNISKCNNEIEKKMCFSKTLHIQ